MKKLLKHRTNYEQDIFFITFVLPLEYWYFKSTTIGGSWGQALDPSLGQVPVPMTHSFATGKGVRFRFCRK